MVLLPELKNCVAVGSVTERSARLWFRSGDARHQPLWLWLWPSAGEPERGWPIEPSPDPGRDGTGAVQYPEDFPGAPPLEPGAAYRFRITRGEGTGKTPDSVVGEGRFESAPAGDAARSVFSFALMSCHQPFDESGRVAPRAAAMLEQLEPALERHGAKYCVLLGDQLYADKPPALSLFASAGPLEDHGALAPEAIRAAYQQRHRQFWFAGMTASLARRASYVALDDHEICDNWGSLPKHRREPWRRLGTAAIDAAFDYQLSRNLPEARRRGPHHHAFRWGRTATFIMDLRGERWAEEAHGQIVHDEQLAALEAFLDQHQDSGALFIGTSVPIVFLPRWFMQLGAFWPGEHPAVRDRWTWPGWKGQHDRVLELLLRQRQRQPRQQLVLLSGDIHESLASALHPPSGKPLYQLVSSPVTNTAHGVVSWLAHAASCTTRSIECHGSHVAVTHLPGTPGAGSNPHRDLNIALVEVDAGAGEARLRFKVLSPSAHSRELDVVFDSGELE